MTASVPLSFIDLCNKSLGFYENKRRKKNNGKRNEILVDSIFNQSNKIAFEFHTSLMAHGKYSAAHSLDVLYHKSAWLLNNCPQIV